jgi:TonB family protein
LLAAPVLTKAPVLVHKVEASYPALAEAIDGVVLMHLVIDAGGLVARVEVVQSTHPAFAEAAAVAATQFVFSPAGVDGAPAPIQIEYRTTFVAAMEPAVAAPPPVTLRAVVYEAGVRKPLAGALVVAGAERAVSDASGRFSLTAVGDVTLEISSPMYEPYSADEQLSTGETLEAEYFLARQSQGRYETLVRTRRRREVARIQLDRHELSKVPGTSGDPIRVIENLPGMARTPGGLGGALLVRGANPTDSRVFIDGVEVPLIYHFGGLTSVVNAEMLERIDFYPGGFGVRYGASVAGVVDVTSRDLDCELWRGAADLGLLHLAAFTCVPLRERWTLGIAARRSYVDLWLRPAVQAWPRGEDEGVTTVAPVYYDYQVKVHGREGHHQWDFFLFGSDDNFKLLQSGSSEDVNFDVGLHLGHHRLLAKHRLRLSPAWSLTSLLAPGVQANEIRGSSSDVGLDNRFAVDVGVLTWREEASFEVSDQLALRFGLDWNLGSAEVSFHSAIPSEVVYFPSPTVDYTDAKTFAESLRSFNHGYWLELDARPWSWLQLIAGFRFDAWDFHHTQDVSYQPRLTVRWSVAPNTVLKGAYGIYEKLPEPPYLLSEPMGNPALVPLRSRHFVIGVEQALSEALQLDLQGFYNLRAKIPSPAQNIVYEGGRADTEVWISEGGGTTVGMELLLRHVPHPDTWYHGWVAYTLSKSVRVDHFPDPGYALQRGSSAPQADRYEQRDLEEYPAPFDQTHILTLVGQARLPYGFEAGVRFRYVSGNPYTPLDQGAVYYDADRDGYGVDLRGVAKNSARMPAFHQLDVRIDRTFVFDLWKLTAYLEVLNAYNQGNVERFQWDYRYRHRTALTFLPILPVLGVKGEF